MAKKKKDKEEEKEAPEADAKADAPEGEGAAEGEGGGKKKLPIMKLALFIGAPLVLIIIGVAAAFFLGLFGGKKHDAKSADKGQHIEGKAAAAEVAFVDLPELLVNLNTSGKGSSFLKLQLAIEIPKEVPPTAVQPAMPRIMDRFQVFLRELRVDDLSGSAGTYRLKQELLRRVRLSGLAVQVNDVLIREMIIQ